MEKEKELKGAFVERDLSWMYFNHRILQEAEKKEVPILERMSFLGIYSNNLDEFFRVRMASLNRLALSKDKNIKADRERAKKTIKDINHLNACYNKEFEKAVDDITEELEAKGIRLLHETELNEEQQLFIRRLYLEKLNGSTNPIWLSQVKEIGATGDDGIFLAIKRMEWHEDKKKPKVDYALIAMPDKELGRFVRLPKSDGMENIMYLDDVIRYCLPMIFIGEGKATYEAYSFKFTKDAEMEMDNDLNSGVMQKVAKGVKSRKSGEPIRVIYDDSMPKELLKRIMSRLNIDTLDTIVSGGRYQNHKDLMAFPDCGRTDLKYPKWTPILKPELETEQSILDTIRQKDRFIHVPYHSFNSFIRVLREAALNPDVKAINVTLYRLAKASKVVKALICAARNGKKVTVVIELLARFDEESNIKWSKRLQEAGVEVVFGVEGLKIHSKLVYIQCKSGDIACIGTGNLHEGNAKVYTDYMMMTARPQIVREVKKVFEFISKPFKPVKFRELLVSPNEMKPKILRLISDEIRNAKEGLEAWIKVKINHITDEDVVAKLYEASQAGVKISLLVRGNCSLVPGLPGVSENISALGVIDTYLEHARILIFANGGNPKYFLGSADWMPRNLVNRIEVLTPVYDEQLQHDLERTIDYGLRDTTNARIVDGRGGNQFKEGAPFRSQEQLYVDYLKESQEMNNVINQ
ncbi:MAG: RNA degradosome polyphosphate kinase [Prevotella sp.]|nr:RNA degradosome polyphosphate kinase [Prevotella sp.]MDD7075035.1 RNA degradosome polyphosphate kinase [Prevotellaceae bacterium]MDY5342607.1 RNA degradosome polyphosphate kinase [Prevotella sp.]